MFSILITIPHHRKVSMALAQRNALGAFPDLQHAESALDRLKSAGFPMHNIATIVQQIDEPAAEKLANLTESISEPGERFADDRNIDRIEKGAAGAGAVGTVAGGILAGLTTLAFPVAGGAVILAGMLGGAFYGTVTGGLMGGAAGINISDEQAKHYSELLERGYYLVTIKGTESEMALAESVLKDENIQDWTYFRPV
jgi:hypothetical protein